MNEIEAFEKEVRDNLRRIMLNPSLYEMSLHWLTAVAPYKYAYNFKWLGVPIIQFPQDIVAMQEIIWVVRPDLIIETGIAHGGSLIMSASMLALLEYSDVLARGELLDPTKPRRKVLGVDIEIRSHNRARIEAHPMASRIEMIEGSSVASEVVAQVRQRAEDAHRVLVFLDSHHTHDHVLSELEAYGPLVSEGSYCVVFDTGLEDIPENAAYAAGPRPWGKGNNPKTAVWEYLKKHPEFEIDEMIQHKLLITCAPDGFLRRVQ